MSSNVKQLGPDSSPRRRFSGAAALGRDFPGAQARQSYEVVQVTVQASWHKLCMTQSLGYESPPANPQVQRCTAQHKQAAASPHQSVIASAGSQSWVLSPSFPSSSKLPQSKAPSSELRQLHRPTPISPFLHPPACEPAPSNQSPSSIISRCSAGWVRPSSYRSTSLSTIKQRSRLPIAPSCRRRHLSSPTSP